MTETMGGGAYFSTEQRLQWHPEVHWIAGQESLHYWFLSFSTSYEWDVLHDELEQLLRGHGVTSYALYELMGEFDVLLRVWLPQGTAGVFRAELQSRLEKFSLLTDMPYFVEKVIRHWPFGVDGKGPLKSLGQSDLELDPEGIDRTNKALAAGAKAGDKFLTSLAERGVIGPDNHPEDQILGVKTFTLIKPITVLTNAQKRGLAKQLARTLDRQQKIRQRSLYQVDGQDAAFILSCLIPDGSFFAFREELIQDLAPLLETVGARTVSYSCPSRDLLLFHDLLRAPDARHPPRPEPRPLKELLSLEESATLEVKGSAFSPLDPWLFGEEQLVESPLFFHRGVLRAIVGFLNGEGGSIVIGALEQSRYQDRLSDHFRSRLERFKDIGAYMCGGLVDPTYTVRGWDIYERRIGDLIASNVVPDPSPLISIRKEKAEGLTFCVIDVQPGRDIGWHYLEAHGSERGAQFLVRQGARTVALEGIAADRYKVTAR